MPAPTRAGTTAGLAVFAAAVLGFGEGYFGLGMRCFDFAVRSLDGEAVSLPLCPDLAL
jgi:hypothetical protein